MRHFARIISVCLAAAAVTINLATPVSWAHEGGHEDMKPNTHPKTGDAAFDRAVELINAGDAQALEPWLAQHPDLVTQRAKGHKEYERGYFTAPTLLHFTAFNPWWNPRTVVPKATPQVMRVLLEAGAPVDAQVGEPNNRWTVLGLITSGIKTRQAGVEDQMIELLAQHGADLTAGIEGAVAYSDWDALDTLIRLGVEKTPMVLAVQGDASALRAALAKSGDDSLAAQRALFAAVVKGQPACVKVALEAGADPSAYMPSPLHPGATAMHQAAWNNHVEILKIMLAQGGRTDVKDKNHDATPLGWALHAHHDQAATLLLQHTDIDPTPQQLAAWGMVDRLAQTIQDNPDSIHAVGEWGTCLQQAAFHGRVQIVKLLLAHGAKVNQTDGGDRVPGGGVTALDKALSTDLGGSGASLEDRAACAQLLRDHGGLTGDEIQTSKPADR